MTRIPNIILLASPNAVPHPNSVIKDARSFPFTPMRQFHFEVSDLTLK